MAHRCDARVLSRRQRERNNPRRSRKTESRFPGKGPLPSGLAPQLGAMPLSVSSLIAVWFFDRCAKPIPRNTFGALVN
jgi:hypothetical protein